MTERMRVHFQYFDAVVSVSAAININTTMDIHSPSKEREWVQERERER
jgi:hypothetical protein